MADQQEMDFTYTFLDRIFRYSIGEHGDFSGAFYGGDFSMSLEQAQRRKHEFIAAQLNIGPGTRVLDMSCGWGPFLAHLAALGAEGIGATLSKGQVESCRKNGLDVHLKDCREITPDTFGMFDAVVSVGGFEHFCSIEQWQDDKQDAIYDRFFRHVAALLPEDGRFYMQTMVFGKNMIPFEAMDLNAPVDSDAFIVAALAGQFPGSWLPYGDAQVLRCAAPYFKAIYTSSGRLDYIETIHEWGKRYRQFNLKKHAYYATLLPRYLFNPAFREHLKILQTGANRKCFEREILDHYRFVFEKS